jgi:succinate dehydrogenase/fumarate reductase flavoprotein subunit
MGQACDVLVIGGGGAALRAAIAAHESAPDRRVVLVTKGKLGQSGVTATACSDRMAFHATLPTTEPGGPEAWRYHAEDIYRIGGCVSDADLAEVLARHAAEAFDYLDRLSVPFVRRADGTVDQFVTDGSKHARACYTGPYTANHIHAALLGRFHELGLEAWGQTMVAELLPAVGGRRIAGVLLVDEHSGERTVVQAKVVVLATGGAGAAFAVNVFPDDCTGDGYALAYRAGAQLVNLEFIQIGLSSVKTRLACSGSMMRALPRLVNDCDEEFLPHYFAPDTPMAEIYNILFAKGASWPVSLEEPSHRIDIAVERERAAGRRVFLDFSRNPESLDWEALDPAILRWYREVKGVGLNDPALRQSPLHRLEAINPQSVAWLQERGIDLKAGQRVEIAPAIQHFQGGVKIRTHGETTLPGLYAAGEVSGGQHGANRPGGNALLDCQVFGRIAGESGAQIAAELAPLDESVLTAAMSGLAALTEADGLPAAEVRTHAQRIVADAAGVVRTESGLRAGLKALAALRAEGMAADEHGLAYAVETRNTLDVTELVIRAALHRDESRGPHLRFASPDAAEPIPRDDSRWQRYTVIQRGRKGAKLRAVEPVRPTWEWRE